MKIKKIKWSKPKKPNDHIEYDHIIGEHPIHTFFITWKGWKERPLYELEFGEHYHPEQFLSIQSAKIKAQKIINRLVERSIED